MGPSSDGFIGDLEQVHAQLDADALELRGRVDRAGDNCGALDGHFLAGDDAGFGAGADEQVGRREDLRPALGKKQSDEVVELQVAGGEGAEVDERAFGGRRRPAGRGQVHAAGLDQRIRRRSAPDVLQLVFQVAVHADLDHARLDEQLRYRPIQLGDDLLDRLDHVRAVADDDDVERRGGGDAALGAD